MEFFEIVEGLETRDGGETIGLDRENLEVRQGVQAFDFGDLVLAKPELF